MRLYYKDIKNLLKESYLSSGRDYFNKGKVRNVSINKSHAKSEVSVYRVKLKYDGPFLSGKCSCPAFVYYGPCKHMAATGFALVELDRKEYRSSARPDEQTLFERFY